MGTGVSGTAWHGRRVAQALGALLLALTLAGPGTVGTGAQGEEAPLDLAAMALLPADLAAEGMDGYAVDTGRTLTAGNLAAGLAAIRGESAEETEEQLVEAGLQRAYQLALDLPADSPDDEDQPLASVVSVVYQFADEDGAEEVFDGLAGFVTGFPEGEAVRADTVGDASTLVRTEDDSDEIAFTALDLRFRSGNLVGTVVVRAPTEDEPTAEDAVALGERLVDRMDDVRQDGGPGLSTQAVLLLRDGDLLSLADGYQVLDGDLIPAYGETKEERETRAADLGDATDAYRVFQVLSPADDGGNPTYYQAVLRRFADEETAAAFLDDVPDRIADDDRIEDAEVSEDAPVRGDGAVSVSYTVAGADLQARLVIVRLGGLVASVGLLASEAPPADAVADLAEAQLGCLEGSACPEPIPAPEGLEQP